MGISQSKTEKNCVEYEPQTQWNPSTMYIPKKIATSEGIKTVVHGTNLKKQKQKHRKINTVGDWSLS